MKLKFGKELWVFVSTYDPGSERDETEREAFQNNLDDCFAELNIEEDRESEILVVGRENGVLGLNNTQITKEKVQGVVKEMKAGLDRCTVECLKSGATNVINWLQPV